MATVGELLEMAKINIDNGQIGVMLAKAQITQYQDFKKFGVGDDEDIDETLDKYPECNMKLNF